MVNPALEGFGAKLEPGWEIKDKQLYDPNWWIDNTLTSKIEVNKKAELRFLYKIKAEPSSRSTPDSYCLEFLYKCDKDSKGVKFPDDYNPDIDTLTKEELL